MKLEPFSMTGELCSRHGFTSCKCADKRMVTLKVKLYHVVQTLRFHYPIFLPYNYVECYEQIVKGERSLLWPRFVHKEEPTTFLISESISYFFEEEKVREWLKGLGRIALEHEVQKIRATTNARAFYGHSLVRSADAELFGHCTRPELPVAGNLDRGVTWVKMVYDGRVPPNRH